MIKLVSKIINTGILRCKVIIMDETRQNNNEKVQGTRERKDKKVSIKSGVVFIYNVISVVSTLTILSGLVLFVYGNIKDSNTSDNNLIMEQIKKATKEEDIISVNAVDIYGFGNESIIVTASNYEKSNKEDYGNKLVILDKMDNEILQKMNDFFGLKSNFKTTHNYSIYCEDVCFIPKTRYVIDISGDKTKEVIVQYMFLGSVDGANGTAIFKYSYDDEQYHIIGTYPNCEKMDLRVYDKGGNLCDGIAPKEVETNFSKLEDSSWSPVCFDGEKKFTFNNGLYYCKEYWVDCTAWGRVLVIVHVDKYDQQTYINVYYPEDKDEDGNELVWKIIFSEKVKKFSTYYTRDDLAKELVKILDGEVKFLEEIEEW